MLGLQGGVIVMATKKSVVRHMLREGELFSYYMPDAQRRTLLKLIDGEEGDYFVHTLEELADRIGKMPKPYETDGQCKDAVVHLHYFVGAVDAWITERDSFHSSLLRNDPECPQHQTFGLITLTGDKGDAELGYISIKELIDNGVELDLHWEPKTLGEVMA